jgi:hypothetical protein
VEEHAATLLLESEVDSECSMEEDASEGTTEDGTTEEGTVKEGSGLVHRDAQFDEGGLASDEELDQGKDEDRASPTPPSVAVIQGTGALPLPIPPRTLSKVANYLSRLIAPRPVNALPRKWNRLSRVSRSRVENGVENDGGLPPSPSFQGPSRCSLDMGGENGSPLPSPTQHTPGSPSVAEMGGENSPPLLAASPPGGPSGSPQTHQEVPTPTPTSPPGGPSGSPQTHQEVPQGREVDAEVEVVLAASPPGPTLTPPTTQPSRPSNAQAHPQPVGLPQYLVNLRSRFTLEGYIMPRKQEPCPECNLPRGFVCSRHKKVIVTEIRKDDDSHCQGGECYGGKLCPFHKRQFGEFLRRMFE